MNKLKIKKLIFYRYKFGIKFLTYLKGGKYKNMCKTWSAMKLFKNKTIKHLSTLKMQTFHGISNIYCEEHQLLHIHI